jgi:signal transduction histidine kinase
VVAVLVRSSGSYCSKIVGEMIGLIDLWRNDEIFDRFYRVDPARTEAGDRIGLGPPIAKWLAEFYGGKILIESEIGNGTIVTVKFPSFGIRYVCCGRERRRMTGT